MTLKASDLRAEAARIIDAAERLEREERAAIIAAREARKPKEPPIGSVIRFEKPQSGRCYHYAAISFPVGREGSGYRARRWAITNTVTGVTGRYTWAGLLEFIGEANWTTIELWSVEGTKLVDPVDEPAVVERMGPYGQVRGTEVVEDWHGQANASPFGRSTV